MASLWSGAILVVGRGGVDGVAADRDVVFGFRGIEHAAHGGRGGLAAEADADVVIGRAPAVAVAVAHGVERVRAVVFADAFAAQTVEFLDVAVPAAGACHDVDFAGDAGRSAGVVIRGAEEGGEEAERFDEGSQHGEVRVDDAELGLEH